MSLRLCSSLASIVGLGALALALAGCASEAAPVTAESSRFRPADDSAPSDGASDQDPSATPPASPDPAAPPSSLRPGRGVLTKADQVEGAAEPDATGRPPIAVPDGDIATLAKFIDALGRREPEGSNEKEMIASFARNQDARLAAIVKILQQKPDQQTTEGVVSVAFEIFNHLGKLEVPGTRARIGKFAAQLAVSEDKELARLGRFLQFNSDVNDQAGKSPEDGAALVARVKEFIAAEKEDLGVPALAQINSAAETLLGLGLKDDGLAVLALGADAAAAHPDQAIAAEQHRFRDRATMITVDAQSLLEDVIVGEKDAEAKLVEKFKETLAKMHPSGDVAKWVQEVAFLLELTGHSQASLTIYDELKALFEKDLDQRTEAEQELAKKIVQAVDNAHLRASLLGQTLTLEGMKRDGTPFDWSAYQGKVVLVDFWATWCEPCLKELPNIMRNYEDFHERGFDVVGVSMDTEGDNLTRFFETQDLPWAVVTDSTVLDGTADKERWADLPMAKKFGVDGIPFLVLVGKDGKVDSLHVQGPKLRSRLIELLGDPDGEPSAESPAAAKPAEVKPGAPAAEAEKPAEEKPAQEKPAEKPAEEKSVLATPVGMALAMALLAADEPAAAAPADAPPAPADDPAINPYAAKPGLTTEQLTNFILKMLDKPKTIQGRPGFCDAVCEACERVMKADPPATEVQFFVAVEAKFETLHKTACSGDNEADKRLVAFVDQMKADERPRVARQVAFFQQERKVLDAVDGPAEKIPDLLKELLEYYTKEKLEARHLRMASSTVALINKLENGDDREQHFGEFGGAFAKSSNRELARYGKKLAKKPAVLESDLVGKPLELAGTTAKGAAFAWPAYRGKVVLVDFWATWCGPCRREMPNVKALYEKNANRGFEVVGVSLDEDLEALAEYLDENEIPWETLAGEGTQDLAEQYGVRGIPTMMLVDKEGKIVGVSHGVAPLLPLVEKLLAAPAAAPPAAPAPAPAP
jgi:thiol-disulfide isomerase/thioredoxin